MHYTIFYKEPRHPYLDISVTIATEEADTLELQLPAWRPGRYELGNFSKNIQQFRVVDEHNNPLHHHKITKDRWQVRCSGTSKITVHYNFFSDILDAGNTWIDDTQLYINFVNCLLYHEDALNAPCTLTLHLPDDFEVACGLPQPEKHVLKGDSFYQVVDSPMFAAADLTHWTYEHAGSTFHLWFKGNVVLDKEKTLNHFRTFTENQVTMMEGFPCEDYHFLIQFVPYPAYHGVEHFNSTVIVLGPENQMDQEPYYDRFLGVSSHELFHTWNIIRLRPEELNPYDFTQENYFLTGFIAEGLTTYYGDVFLVRSGVWSKEQYFKKLNAVLQRHFGNYGRYYRSVTESSMDLWLDGYQQIAPQRKVSIYIKGAIACLLLDLTIRQESEGKYSLDDYVRTLWTNYYEKGKGYSLKSLQEVAQSFMNTDAGEFFNRFITGTEPVEQELAEQLSYVGCILKKSSSPNLSESRFGFRIQQNDNTLLIQDIAPDSPAFNQLRFKDELVAVNNIKATPDIIQHLFRGLNSCPVAVFRNGRLHQVTLTSNEKEYYPQYSIIQKENPSNQQEEAFTRWINASF